MPRRDRGRPRQTTLYSDADVTVLNYRRVLVVNGIDVGAVRGDLADRMIPVQLKPIAPQQRRTDRDLWAAYETSRPRTAARTDLAEAVIEADPVGTAVTQLLDQHPAGWDGTAGELADALAPPGPLPEHWPRTPADMSGRLKPHRTRPRNTGHHDPPATV